jgi:AcrR family transcriptional regulator
MKRIQLGHAVSERIVRAAGLLFSRQGYYKTGTQEIARLADTSEVTLFRHFEHKEDIFIAALQSSYEGVESRLSMFCRTVDDRTPEEALSKIISLLVEITTFSPELPKLIAVAAVELRGKYEDLSYRLVTPLLSAISSCLKLNIEKGKLRNLNPEIITAAMALTIIAQPGISRLIEGCELSRMNGRETREEFSSFWRKVLIVSESQIPSKVIATEGVSSNSASIRSRELGNLSAGSGPLSSRSLDRDRTADSDGKRAP